jgi:hypothetical protein
VPPRFLLLAAITAFVPGALVVAAEPLHQRIDALIAAKAAGKPAPAPASDAEFLRRAYLDFAGRIPTVAATRAFLADKSPDKRARLIDQLLGGPDYAKRMAGVFHVMLMERLGDHPEWTKYLTAAFQDNRPWDRLARQILRADPADAANRGAAFFLAKRLENYGQNPVDYPALTRDLGRLFLGKNLQCAQCHDHIYIDEYKQAQFQGLFAFVQNVALFDAKLPAVAEKPVAGKVAFMSVFKKVNRETGPALPGGKEFDPPVFKKGEEFLKAPDPKAKTPGVPKFSTLALLAEQLPRPENADFNRNIVNRLWFVLMGRGLVHPLDMHHADNPPSHPELLDLLAAEFVAHKYDIKWLLRELALTETYQRSSELPKAGDAGPELFLTAIEKKLSAEQLLENMLEAAGERQTPKSSAELLAKFQKAFANAPREPEEEFNPSLRAALFVLNDPAVLTLLSPRDGNLVDRLRKLEDAKVAEELYLSILTRPPTDAEAADVRKYLEKHAAKRPAALGQLVWALLASTEFGVNH